MNDTDSIPSWKPINQELLTENIDNGLVKSVTITEITNNEYVIDVEISWRTEPSRIMQNKDKTKPRTFKNLTGSRPTCKKTSLTI